MADASPLQARYFGGVHVGDAIQHVFHSPAWTKSSRRRRVCSSTSMCHCHCTNLGDFPQHKYMEISHIACSPVLTLRRHSLCASPGRVEDGWLVPSVLSLTVPGAFPRPRELRTFDEPSVFDSKDSTVIVQIQHPVLLSRWSPIHRAANVEEGGYSFHVQYSMY